MRTSWNDSTYYTRLDDLVNLRDAGLPNDEFTKRVLALMDEELADDMWLRNHMNSTAEYLTDCESIEDAERCGFTIDQLLYQAREEIKIFRKYGMDADWYEEILERNMKHLNVEV